MVEFDAVVIPFTPENDYSKTNEKMKTNSTSDLENTLTNQMKFPINHDNEVMKISENKAEQDLKIQNFTVNKEKLFKCKKCEKEFTQNSYLETHR